MAETKKYVRIKKASVDGVWYADKIGNVYEVDRENCVSILTKRGIRGLSSVLREDVEIFVTEKRPAKVGERVLITEEILTSGVYKTGDILTVRSVVNSYGTITVKEHSNCVIAREYEVIVNNEVKNEEADGLENDLNAVRYDELFAHGEDVMRAIRMRAYVEGYRQGTFDAEMDTTYGQAPVVSAQARRDEIVEQAKADVDLCEKSGTPIPSDILKFWPRDNGKERYLPIHEVEYVVNYDKRAVVVLIKRIGGEVVAKGIAKAAPNDCFNVHIGKAIALRRALGLTVPDEYLNAPQPTEVRVGDVVSNSTGVFVGGVLPDDSWRPLTGNWVRQSDARKYGALVIDDSREEVGE